MGIKKNSKLLLISFSIVFGWVMSLPYEGPILYAFADLKGFDGIQMNTITVFMHFAGLLLGAFFSKDIIKAKSNIVFWISTCIVISLLIPFVSVTYWLYMIPFLAFVTGLIISSNAFFIRNFVPIEERTKMVSDILIWGNIILIASALFAMNIHPMIAFSFIQVLMFIALYTVLKMDIEVGVQIEFDEEKNDVTVFKKLWIFFLFIFIITINSGIMFQVIYPYFSDFTELVSLYTNIPYIAAIFILSRFYKKNKFYFLYVGLALWGMTFIIFAFANQTPLSFVLICTLMLFSAGIFDLFWWGVMATHMDHLKNPARLFGVGLSINVFGVWVGGLIGNYMMNVGADNQTLAFFGLFIVIVSMLIILPLNSKLSDQLESYEFLVELHYVDKNALVFYLDKVTTVLSKREYDVFELLIDGKTDSEMSKLLFISPHTIKTHNRSIYKKLKVSNRVELLEQIKKLA